MHPEDEASGRLEDLPTLPIFFKLRGRSVLVVGGGDPAVWKAELLVAAGARVHVVAEVVSEGLARLADRLGSEALVLDRRPWVEGDLTDQALALGVFDDLVEGLRFQASARRLGVPVNVVDKPEACDFQFGTLVTRGSLVLAITTDGAAPVFGQAIRSRLEALLPEGLRAWARAAKDWRPRVQARNWNFRRRRRFWEAFADAALEHSDRIPNEGDFAACAAAVEAVLETTTGEIVLVGSGPGRPESLTFAAARALQQAEVLFYEPDLPGALINMSRREADKRLVVDDSASLDAAVTEARQGRRTVWLGSGNPASCARWARRARQLSEAGAAWTQVEGLSSCRQCQGCCPADSMN